MANILQTLLPSFATDVVAIYDQNFTQLFRNARAIKATIKEEAKVMEHPVETGATITDHRIILPVEIELSLMLATVDYQDVYRSIRQYYLNATLLTIQTRTGTYNNQLIASMPHEEDTAQFNAVSLALSLKQVQFITPQFSVQPKNARHSTTVDRGTQQSSTPIPIKESAARIAYKKAINLVKG